TNTFNFGHHSFQVHFSSILGCFSISMTAVMSKPSEVDADDFNSPIEFAAGTKGLRYSSKHGSVTEYLVPSPPQAGVNYPVTDPAYQIKVGYFTLQQFQTPGLAKTGDVSSPKYQENITHDFWPSGAPGADPEDSGEADTWSGFVVFNSPLTLGTQCGTPIIK